MRDDLGEYCMEWFLVIWLWSNDTGATIDRSTLGPMSREMCRFAQLHLATGIHDGKTGISVSCSDSR
jgi:hypothetical protein